VSGPRTAESWLRQGDLLLDAGNAASAEVAYRSALEAEPDDAGAHRGLGRALIHQGSWSPRPPSATSCRRSSG
jgi:cytochrome c-type biogenesis protein CcmH/NrfG